MATYLYHTKHDDANYRVVAVSLSTDAPHVPTYHGDAIYTHASTLVGVGQILPTGSTLVSQRNPGT